MELSEKCMKRGYVLVQNRLQLKCTTQKTVNPVNYIYRTTIQKPVNQSVKANLTTCGQ